MIATSVSAAEAASSKRKASLVFNQAVVSLPIMYRCVSTQVISSGVDIDAILFCSFVGCWGPSFLKIFIS